MSKKTALILAGGEAIRMRPVSCTRPKAMISLFGMPIMGYAFERLREQGWDEIIIAADRLSNHVAEHFEGEPETDFLLSSVPEGICAAIGRAAELLQGDMLTVVFGDVLADFDFSAAEAFHLSSSADVTILTSQVDRPWEHTLAVTEDSGAVTEILPDPARESCRSDRAVAGAFVFRRETAEKAKNHADFCEFLNSLISDGGRVHAYEWGGNFVDIDSPEDIFTAVDALRSGCMPWCGKIAENRLGHPLNGTIIPPSAKVEGGAKIGGGTIIGENVTICRGAQVNGSIIFDGAYIGERVTAEHGIICSGARLLAGSAVQEGAVIGECAVIGEQAVVQNGVKIWNGRHIDSYTIAARDVRHGFLPRLRITEDGICGETGSIISPQTAAQVGSAVAALGGKIGIACRDNPASKSLALALAAGVTAAGGEAWFFGGATEPALCFCTKKSGLSAGCWVDAGVTAKIKFCSGDGLPLTRSEEKIIEGGVNRSEYPTAPFAGFGRITDCSAMLKIYENMLERLLPSRLEGIRCVINTSGSVLTELCGRLLRGINDKNGEPIVFHIGSDGRGVSAYTDATGYVFEEKLVLICCKARFSQGMDVAVQNNFPMAADKLAREHGRQVLRYSGCPSDSKDRAARELAAETPFVRDGAALIFSVLKVLSERGISLAEAVAELPQMAVATRFVAVDSHPVKLLGRLSDKQASGDGITIGDTRGRVLIRPVKTDKGVLMQVESYSMEAAGEICDFYQDLLMGRV